MLGLRKMIQSLIGESITTDQALDAIRNKYYVRIRYNDEQEAPHEGTRVIMPVAVGTTKKGYPVVRAFQTQGDTRRGAPKWKFFRLDRISAWTPFKNKQFTIAPDLYNYDGDRSMKTFIDNAKFDDREMSPLERTRAEFQTRMNAPKSKIAGANGQVGAAQQWKKNVYTSQPNSRKYAQYAKNIDDTSGEANRFDDDIWSRAEAERDAQTAKASYDDYDVDYIDYEPDDYGYPNTNRRS